MGPSGAGGGRERSSVRPRPSGRGRGAVGAARSVPAPPGEGLRTPRPRFGRCPRAAMLRAAGRALPQARVSCASSAYVPAMLMENPFPKAAADSRSPQNRGRVYLPRSPTPPPRWAPQGFPFSLCSVQQFAAACPSFGPFHLPPSVSPHPAVHPSLH